MRFLKIKHVGPIEDVELNIKQINVIIGPQSSGKSTIAKIISFCLWLENDVLEHQSCGHVTPEFFTYHLLDFHKLNEYVYDDFEIQYTSDIIDFTFRKDSLSFNIMNGFDDGKLGKTVYIPAERNIISLPGIESLPMGNTNIRRFLFDWLGVHRRYTQQNTLNLLNLNVKYYFQEEAKQDHLILENGKDIKLDQASSGLQSLVPLCVYLDYLFNWLYENPEDISYEKQEIHRQALHHKLIQLLNKNIDDSKVDKILQDNTKFREALDESIDLLREQKDKTNLTERLGSLLELENNIKRPHYTNLIIEEPELNLFPKTQTDLIYDILSKISENKDQVVITTHSPYVLYALNNCILGGLVGTKVTSEDDLALKHRTSWIKPENVSIWSLTNGRFVISEDNENNNTIQDEDGLIRDNFFDDIMNDIMADFTNLLNYYE